METYFLVKTLLQASNIIHAAEAAEQPSAPQQPAAEKPSAESPEAQPAEPPAEEAQQEEPKKEKSKVEKKNVNYREEERFKDAGFGYFCSTCVHFNPSKGSDGTCTKFDWPVKTYGICTAYKMQEDENKWLPASGSEAKPAPAAPEAPAKPAAPAAQKEAAPK